MVPGQGALALLGGDDGGSRPFRHPAESGGGGSGGDAAPGPDQGSLGRRQQANRSLQLLVAGSGGPSAGGGGGCRRLGGAGECLPRDLDQGGPGPAIAKREHGLMDGGRDLVGQRHLEGEVGHRPEDPELVGHVMEVAPALAPHSGWVLVDDVEHRHAVVVGGGHGGDRVEAARPARGERHPHLARGPGISVGHEHRSLLVAGLDVAQGRMVEQGVVDRQRPHPGDPEQGGDAFGEQALDQGVGAGAVGHGRGRARRGRRSPAAGSRGPRTGPEEDLATLRWRRDRALRTSAAPGPWPRPRPRRRGRGGREARRRCRLRGARPWRRRGCGWTAPPPRRRRG